ncbi:MAG: hypothetical protein GX963_03020 [Bacteroidales bacterium]|nr:hypothetical protein [Bacteroidales bacterium]
MEIKKLTSNNVPELTNLQELSEGCTTAITTYAVKQNFGSNELKQTKIIILFDRNDFDEEAVEVGARTIMVKQGNISLCKSFVYQFRKGLLKRTIQFASVLYRNILGFIPNGDIHDCKNIYNDYHGFRKGGVYYDCQKMQNSIYQSERNHYRKLLRPITQKVRNSRELSKKHKSFRCYSQSCF